MLKKASLIFLCCLCLPALYADTHKQRMIDYINEGRFEDATKELPFVEDWKFDNRQDSLWNLWIKIDKGIEYSDFIQNEQLVDSLLLYIADESNVCANYYKNEGDYDTAVQYAEAVVSFKKHILGKQHPDYANSLHNLGIIYEDLGQYAEAEKCFLDALQIYESTLGKRHPACAKTLNEMGIMYEDLCHYENAEKYYNQALRILRSAVEKDSLSIADVLSGLGLLYYDKNDYSKAEYFLLNALQIRLTILGAQNTACAHSLTNLGLLYDELGNYEKAETYYNQALHIYESTLGKQHPNYAMISENLGILYTSLGQYEKAETCYNQALHIYESTPGKQHPDYAGALINLGGWYYLVGDTLNAKGCLLEAKQISEAILGEQHTDYANSLIGLGVLFSKLDDDVRAEHYYIQALNIYNESLGMFNPSSARSLDNLGALYAEKGEYTIAKKYFKKGLKIREKVYGKRHPDYACSLDNLGLVYAQTGDYTKSKQYLISALKIRRLVLGDEHPDYANTLENLCLLYSNMGNHMQAKKYCTDARAIHKTRFIQSIEFLTEQQRDMFWSKIKKKFFTLYPNFAYKYLSSDASLAAFAYDNELFVKGLLLNSTETIRRSIAESGDTVLVKCWENLALIKQQIIALQENDSQSEYLHEIRKKSEQLEKEITKSSAAYRENKAMWQITWDSVRNHLNKDQIAIEYMVAPLSKDSTMYCALLLRDTCTYPILIPLFEEKEVQTLISASTENQIYNHNASGTQISSLVWSKVLPRIKKGETVYFAPSGLLHQLAIESLPFDSTHTMGDMYNLIRLSSTREIVLNKSAENHTTATLYGGIQYDVDTEELLAESEAYSTKHLLASRGIEADTLNRGLVNYLAGTKTEVENINRMLKQNHLQVQLFTATNANEESFKALSGTHQNILHIATHGFFWSDSTAQKKDYFAERMMLLDDKKPAGPIIDPLNRCGLLFAGANLALQGHSNELPEGVQDGILTAKEISLLDLRDADLVVLSACETGKGEITGDGVFGLQRAFKQAGAQTIIMSLWPVNDAATQMLMTEFYKNWITNHQSKRVAFSNAQNAVRGKYSEPAYWAGFVMLD